MAVSKKPPRPWKIDYLLRLGTKTGATYLKAVPVLYLENWVRGERKEGRANFVKTKDLANRLESSKVGAGFSPSVTMHISGALLKIQKGWNLVDPPLIEFEASGIYRINLPHYEPLLQKYRQVYRDRYPEDYKRLFPEGEPEWVLSSLLEAQVERKEMEPMRIESEGQDEIQSLLRPLEQALRGRQEAIDRLTQENRKLQAELAVLQAQERKSADKELMFVHTSPDFHHSVYGRRVTSIKDTIEAMLQRAQHSIRVSTLQIDIFADDLIALKRRNPKLEITVLTRAKAQGDRKGIATRAIPRMKNAGIKVQTDQELLHSRMLVIDDREVLVSSADLDVTQMQLEFNAGIWSNSSDVVCEAISYFDNILNARRQQP